MFIGTRIGIPMMQYGTALSRLQALGGLLFYKDFRNGTLDAEYSVGSPTGIYTRSGGASNPSGYVNSAGLWVPNLSSDVPNFWNGYYDETGFHAARLGYGAFRSSTNLLTHSTNFAVPQGSYGWYGYEQVSSDSVIAPDGTTGNYKYTCVGTSHSLRQLFNVTAGTKYTFSFYVKKGTMTEMKFSVFDFSALTNIVAPTSYYSSLGGEWNRVSVVFTAPAGCSQAIVYLERDSGVGGTAYFWGAQCEPLPYATPFIPTTTTALTRNADILRFDVLNNLPTDDATVIVSVTPFSDFSNDGNYRFAFQSNYKPGIGKSTSGQALFYASGTSYVSTPVTIEANTKYVLGLAKSHSSPYASAYKDGVLLGTDTTHDYVSNAESYFYIGSFSNTNHFDGNIEAVAIYNRALTAEENAYVYGVLAGS